MAFPGIGSDVSYIIIVLTGLQVGVKMCNLVWSCGVSKAKLIDTQSLSLRTKSQSSKSRQISYAAWVDDRFKQLIKWSEWSVPRADFLFFHDSFFEPSPCWELARHGKPLKGNLLLYPTISNSCAGNNSMLSTCELDMDLMHQLSLYAVCRGFLQYGMAQYTGPRTSMCCDLSEESAPVAWASETWYHLRGVRWYPLRQSPSHPTLHANK